MAADIVFHAAQYYALGYSSASATLTGVSFGAGVRVLCIAWSDASSRSISSITSTTGAMFNLQVETSGLAIYTAPAAPATVEDVTVTLNLAANFIFMGALTGTEIGDASAVDIATRAQASTADPKLFDNALVTPDGGVGLAFVTGTSNTIAVNNGALLFEGTGGGGTGHRALIKYGVGSVTPSYNIGQHTNSAGVAAAWAGGSLAGISGTLAAQESGADTASITGAVRVSGTLSAAESGSDEASLSGSVPIAGTLAAAESGSDAVAMAGAVRVKGALTAQESGADTADLSGRVTVSGTLSATETGSDTAHFSGFKQDTITGTLAASEVGSDTCTMTGAVVVSGALAAGETGQDSASFAGSVPIGGQLAAVESANDNAIMSGRVLVTGLFAAIETGSDIASFRAGAPPPLSARRAVNSLRPLRYGTTAVTSRIAVSAR